ncbi:MAG: arylsulfatase [Verrucomicrobiota bacterium]
MNRLKRPIVLGFLAVFLASGVVAEARPNIVFIMADDLGYGDLQCYASGSAIPTPYLNEMAAEGMRFTDAHSGSAVCTPTRYGVITGRYSWRTEMKRGVLNGYSPPLIKPDRLTVGGMLQEAGYDTACIGKWHLGLDWTIVDDSNPKLPRVDYSVPLKNGPTARGFDYFFGISASLDMSPYCYIENELVTMEPTIVEAASPFPKFWREGERSEDFVMVEVLDVLAEKADRYIQERAATGEPFFLYMPLPAPHKPIIESDEFAGKTEWGPYGDFVMQVDATVGKVLDSLDVAGVTDNTLVMVTSDNGSFMYHTPDAAEDHLDDASIQAYTERDSNAPLRGTKADVWDGGHRVPFIVRWPGVVEEGSICDEPICHVDLMATCAAVAGIKGLPKDAAEDSFSLVPLLKTGKWGEERRAPVVHHSGSGMFAIRDGKWKLVFGSGSGGREKPAGKRWAQPYHLFDMNADIGETDNLYEVNPEVVQRLEAAMLELMAEGRSR